MTKTLLPRDENDLADMVKRQASRKEPIEIIGGGSRKGLGHDVEAPTHISTKKINGITLYEPGALTIVAKSGTPLETINETLAAEGQHLPFEPALYNTLLGTKGKSTIGGVVACGVSGPRRIQTGACRDSLIGVRFVNGEGDAIKNGGRVMKNVTGYDLVKLMCGSHGTLGVLSEVSFKLLPKPECMATVSLNCKTASATVNALSKALTSPFDVTGASGLCETKDDWVTSIRVEGFEGSVKYRSRQLAELLSEFGETMIEDTPQSSQETWNEMGSVASIGPDDGAIWKINVAPTHAPKFLEAVKSIQVNKTALDWGGGLVWLAVEEHGDCGAGLIRSTVDQLGGHATLLRASVETKKAVPVFHQQPTGLKKLSDGIKSKFDPLGILNPGRMGA